MSARILVPNRLQERGGFFRLLGLQWGRFAMGGCGRERALSMRWERPCEAGVALSDARLTLTRV